MMTSRVGARKRKQTRFQQAATRPAQPLSWGRPETGSGIAMKIVVALLIERLNLTSSIVVQGFQGTLLATKEFVFSFEALKLVCAGGFAFD